MVKMKTTLEIPDFLFRRAKSVAAERGIPLRQFVTEAVQEKLKNTSQERPWMKHLGSLKHLRADRKQIEKRVEEAFEQIDPEIWK
jgi:RecJ-like exonuclease